MKKVGADEEGWCWYIFYIPYVGRARVEHVDISVLNENGSGILREGGRRGEGGTNGERGREERGRQEGGTYEGEMGGAREGGTYMYEGEMGGAREGGEKEAVDLSRQQIKVIFRLTNKLNYELNSCTVT